MKYKSNILVSALIILAGQITLSGCRAELPTQEVTIEETVVETIAETPTQQIRIKDANTITAGVSKSRPEINIESVESLLIENNEQENLGLLRFPLPTGITADDVIDAELRIKLMSGEQPMLEGKVITASWDRLDVTWANLQEHIVDDTKFSGEMGTDGWYTLDVSETVKDWFSGKYPNAGILLSESAEGVSIFHSSYDDLHENLPELILHFKENDNHVKYAPFDYQLQQDGNCFSFAVRDTNAILSEHLGLEHNVLQQLYSDEGIDGAFTYVKDLVETYLQENQQALQLTSFREIASFDTPIDTEKEYRIAFRIGMDERQFDYHFQVQLADGSWAEKLGPADSRIIPGSNGALSPARFPWHQNELWGIAKWADFYNSQTAFYAIEKSSPEFTAHRD